MQSHSNVLSSSRATSSLRRLMLCFMILGLVAAPGIQASSSTELINTELINTEPVSSAPSPQEASREKISSPHVLVGLWGGSHDMSPEISGTLTIEGPGADGPFVAKIDRHTVPVGVTRLDGSSSTLHFELPDNQGEFRGTLTTGVLNGHWIQPETPFLGYPYASPLAMTSTLASGETVRWTGTVTPYPDVIQLYLSLEEGPNGLEGFIRNPERNVGLFLRFETVNFEKGLVSFLDEQGEETLQARAVNQRGEPFKHIPGEKLAGLDVKLPWNDEIALRMTRSANSTENFYPRDPKQAAATSEYRYQQPTALPNDNKKDWPVAKASDMGVDENALQNLVRQLATQPVDSVFSPYIHAVVIARKGHVILEEYFYGHSRQDLHDTRSAGKSVGSVLVGTVVDASKKSTNKLDLQTRLLDLYPESLEPKAAYLPETHPSDRAKPDLDLRRQWRKQLNLRHLLSMNSGLACNDDENNSPGNENTMQNQSEEPDWRSFALALPIANQPGTEPYYCSNSINLASSMAAASSGEWLPKLFLRNLAQPLGIDHYAMNLTPTRESYFGGGIRLTARDQLKFAQLMLNEGVWAGQRILSEDWVHQSLKAHSSVNEKDDYGLAWWRQTLTLEDTDGSKRDIDVFYSSGNGGQLSIGVPEFDLAVQFSAGNYSNYGTWGKFLNNLLPEVILPALEE